jgi:hypothetical protein
MDALTDTLSKHGVLSSEVKPTRDTAGRFAPKPKVEPLFKQAKVGDWVRTERVYDTGAGTYEVTHVDNDPTTGYRLAINNPGKNNRRWWLLNEAVVEIVPKPEQKPEIDFSKIKVGDSVRVITTRWFDAGTYEVIRVNLSDVEITTPRGRWYAGPSSIEEHIPATPAGPLWKSLQVGNLIEITAQTDNPGGFWTNRQAGIFQVAEIDRDRHVTRDLRILTRSKDGSEQLGWVPTDRLVRVVSVESKPEATKADEQPAYLKAKINDWVRVEGSGSVDDGNYRVMDVDEGDSLRLQVDDGDGGAWVHNDYIKAIVTEPTATSPGSLLRPVTTVQVPVPEMAWKRAKVGDIVRVAGRHGYTAGDFVVDEVEGDDYDGGWRISIKKSDRPGNTLWIPNEIVEMIVTPKAGGAVRGNFLIHVDVPTIMSNRAAAKHDPVIVARKLNDISKPELFRELAWDGPSRFVHHHFQRIEGTDIQNWIETDAPLTCWRDGEAVRTMDAVSPASRQHTSLRPMTLPILGGFVIHIAAPVLMRNRKEGRNDPVIAVRKAYTNWATDIVFARRVEWNGPTRMVHRPSTPIPGTEGRGVSFVETDADVTVYLDDQEPMVLRMPALQAAA